MRVGTDESNRIILKTKQLAVMYKVGLALLGAILAGCSGLGQGDDARVGVELQGPHEYMFVEGSGEKTWFSALELENLARDYVKTNKIDFDFTDSETTIWLSTGGGRILAEVFFSPSRYGRPVLNVKIGRNGKVLEHSIGAKLCGSFLR